METETDMEMEMETDNTRTWTWNWNTFAKYLIWRNSPFSTLRVAADMSQRYFLQRYVIVALCNCSASSR